MTTIMCFINFTQRELDMLDVVLLAMLNLLDTTCLDFSRLHPMPLTLPTLVLQVVVMVSEELVLVTKMSPELPLLDQVSSPFFYTKKHKWNTKTKKITYILDVCRAQLGDGTYFEFTNVNTSPDLSGKWDTAGCPQKTCKQKLDIMLGKFKKIEIVG